MIVNLLRREAIFLMCVFCISFLSIDAWYTSYLSCILCSTEEDDPLLGAGLRQRCESLGPSAAVSGRRTGIVQSMSQHCR